MKLKEGNGTQIVVGRKIHRSQLFETINKIDTSTVKMKTRFVFIKIDKPRKREL